MTTGELIALLQEYPEDSKVSVYIEGAGTSDRVVGVEVDPARHPTEDIEVCICAD